MKRHLSKNEILAKMKEVQKLKNSSDKTPFTGMSTLCNYVLWKKEGWYQKKLGEYNEKVLAYWEQLYTGEIELQTLSDRLWDKADFKIEFVPYTEKDIVTKKKNSFLYEMEKRVIDANNTINEVSARHFTIHFNVLMDMGYGKKRLERNKDYLNGMLGVISSASDQRIMDLHRELYEEAGIYIEMPAM